jgi:hypothetical protein
MLGDQIVTGASAMPEQASKRVTASLANLPIELLFHILGRVQSLDHVFFARFICKRLRPVAVNVFLRRISKLALKDRDSIAISDLILRIRQGEGRGPSYRGFLTRPESLGGLLLRAGLAADSLPTLEIVKHLGLGQLDAYGLADFFKAMEVTWGGLRCALDYLLISCQADLDFLDEWEFFVRFLAQTLGSGW